MDVNMNILCTICCRSGSSGVKDKNIKLINGKPLMAYTIETAKKWGGYNDFIISTDSEKYQAIAKEYGCDAPFLRPQELADSKAGKVGVIRHAMLEMEKLNGVEYDYVIDLDVTSPIRKAEDIENCFKMCVDGDYEIVYSVTNARKNPYFNMVEVNESGYAVLSKHLEKDVLSRQAAPKVYEINGSIYVYKREYLLEAENVYANKAGIYVMDDHAIDIDSNADFDYIEYLLKAGKIEL